MQFTKEHWTLLENKFCNYFEYSFKFRNLHSLRVYNLKLQCFFRNLLSYYTLKWVFVFFLNIEFNRKKRSFFMRRCTNLILFYRCSISEGKKSLVDWCSFSFSLSLSSCSFPSTIIAKDVRLCVSHTNRFVKFRKKIKKKKKNWFLNSLKYMYVRGKGKHVFLDT